MTKRASPTNNERVLVLVPWVIVSRVIMPIVAVIVVVPCVIMSGMRVESVRRWRSCWLRVTVWWIYVSVRVSRVIVAERDAFEITWRAANRFRMAKCNIVRRFTFEDEICGLFGRKWLMTAEPYNERSINHLNRAVFCGSFYVFVDFPWTYRADAPFVGTFEIARYDESPAWDQSIPRGYFDRDSVFHAFERMMDSPVELGVVGLWRWTGPMGIGRMVMLALWGVLRTLSQKVYPKLARKLVVLLGESRLLASGSVSVHDTFSNCFVERRDCTG
jgi:hypothetical protein